MSRFGDLRIFRYADKPIGFVLAIMGAIVFSLLAAGRGPDRDSHDAVLTALREIDLANSSLQRDVLQARAGLLNNYDPLVTSIVKLHDMLSRLTLLSFEEATIGSRLAVPLSRLTVSLATTETLVERFKTNNAMLQNSLSIFSITLSNFHAPHPHQRFPAEWDELGNLMLRFSTHPDPELSPRIGDLLNSVSQIELGASEILRSIALHGKAILEVQPVVDRLVSRIQASDAAARTQDLQKEYLSVYGEISVGATWSRLFLGTVAVILCLYILFLVYRLRLQTDRLAHRLKFENSRNIIKALFDDDRSAGGIDAIRSALSEISAFFGTTCFAFVIFDTDTGDIEEKQLCAASNTSIDCLVSDYLRDPRHSDEDARGRRRFYKSLQSQTEMAFTRDILSAGVAVGMPISKRSAALMVLEYPESQPRASADDIMLMHDALELLTRCIDRLRKNQERDLLENRLEHAERLQAVGTLAAGIAHEFNNILVFMLGYGEMALQIVKRPAEGRRYIEGIIAAGERARRVIEQILALSRKRERASRPFDLGEAVTGIVTLISVSLPENFQISTKLPEDPLVILGNPIELQQIIVNLCNNAVEAAKGTGHLQIEVGPIEIRDQKALSHGILPPGKYIRLRVADDGPGIPEAVMPHIFEPFFTTRPLSGGTGLGLATVHGHIVAHAGYVDVTSIPGRSTQFDIFFPTSHQQPTPMDKFLNHDGLTLGKGETILWLEEEDAMRLMHEEKLAALSYEPIGFRTLDEVTSWLASARTRPDMVILDVASLPETIRPTDLNRLFAGIPYLLIIDQQRVGELSAVNLRGASTLKKPIDLKNLANTLHTMIAERQEQMA
jgi:signal transduction histidine kinase